MLTGLANSPEAAHHCFNLLKSSANGPVSWDHFFGSLKQYYMDLRQDSGRSGYFLTFGNIYNSWMKFLQLKRANLNKPVDLLCLEMTMYVE